MIPLTVPWVVFTGTSCAGKTTTLTHVSARLKLPMISEPARAHIEERVRGGEDLKLVVDSLTSDKAEFQHWALRQRLSLEKTLPTERTLLLDRGVPDSIAYFQLHGLDPAPAIVASRRTRYSSVFWFEPLPRVDDGVRIESERQRLRLSQLLRQAYEEQGYSVVRVPVAPLAERVGYVTDHLSDLLGTSAH